MEIELYRLGRDYTTCAIVRLLKNLLFVHLLFSPLLVDDHTSLSRVKLRAECNGNSSLLRRDKNGIKMKSTPVQCPLLWTFFIIGCTDHYWNILNMKWPILEINKETSSVDCANVGRSTHVALTNVYAKNYAVSIRGLVAGVSKLNGRAFAF